MTDDVKLQAQALGLTDKKIDDEVELFLSVNGENTCIRALEMADANMRKIARTGMHPGTALKSWRWATRKIIGDQNRAEIQSRLDEERAAEVEKYHASIKKGYVPNKETVLAQLEEMYSDGDISITQYNWGVKGLDRVYGHVATAQDEVDPELGF